MKRKYIFGIILVAVTVIIGGWYIITDIQTSQKNKQQTSIEESATSGDGMSSSMSGMDH